MQLTVRSEIIINLEDGTKINPRILDALVMVDNGESLNNAVKELGMSYSYVWNTLYKIKCKDLALIELKRGGNGGGTSILTPQGKKLIGWYIKYRSDMKDVMGTNTLEL